MKLFYRFYPNNNEPQKQKDLNNKLNPKTIIILHGLFGSSKNWISISKELSNHFNVYALDLRNHGDSPHSTQFSLLDMVDDLEEFLLDHKIDSPILLGHSMGGLVVMLYTLTKKSIEPNQIIIQDIAPRAYPFIYDNEVKSMKIDVASANSRSEIDLWMSEYVEDSFIRQFLQMNLERKADSGYYWKLNIDSIANSRKLFDSVFKDNNFPISEVKALFLLGGDSPYIQPEDNDTIHSYFSEAIIEIIPGGGHYIQFTHNVEFMKKIFSFLNLSE